MAAIGVGTAGLQRNRPIPVNRIAASLPGYPESRGYYENRLEPI